MKRFYQSVEAATVDGGFQILLDGRPVRTPKKHLLRIEDRYVADLVAREWDAQKDNIRQDLMPATRMATSVIDLLGERRLDAEAEITGYGRSDLTCYRAATPANLVARQDQHWNPVVEWAQTTFDIVLEITNTIAFVEQPAPTLARIDQLVTDMDDWRLIGLHAATKATGSVLLGLAMSEAAFNARQVYEAACLDELFEREIWGSETDQDKRLAGTKSEIEATESWFAAIRQSRSH